VTSVLRIFLTFLLSLSITFVVYAQDDDSDFLDKVLEDKTKKTDTKKVTQQTNPAAAKKKKPTKNGKKVPPAKTAAKTDPRKTKPVPPVANTGEGNTVAHTPNLPQIQNNKLNLEYWVHEDLAMNPENIPGLEPAKTEVNPPPAKTTASNVSEKPAEKKNPEKTIVDTKSNAIFNFINEYKKVIFIFAAIIIFAIYRLRYVGPRDYNNSGRIFSKFRNK